jgi:hypothetical protein
MFIRNYNSKDNQEVEVLIDSPYGGTKFTDILEVEGPHQTNENEFGKDDLDFSDSKVKRAKNIIVADDEGKIFIFGAPPHLKSARECEVINAHHGPVTVLRRSWDSKIIVSCG